VNFFDADRLAGKARAEVNFFVAQADAAAIGNDNDFVVKGIIDIGQSLVGAWHFMSEEPTSAGVQR
jgi:hypothetical protein